MAGATAEFENVKCIKVTPNAILCAIDGKEIWIPQSQVDDASEVFSVGDEGTLIVTEWIAIQKGLV